MRYFVGLLLSLFVCMSSNAQKTVRMDAIKGNNYGVAYSLPKSVLEVTVEYSKKVKKAGEFYMYSERYLNVSNPITEDITEYELNKIDAQVTGAPDPLQSFLVEFRPNSAMAFVTLTEDGLLCAINADYSFPKNSTDSEKLAVNPTIDARQFFTEEIMRAGSSAKQAELIAKQIYKIRESRNDIITGEADNMPPDGEAYKLVMKQLDDQEKALSGLFLGIEDAQPMKKVIRIDLSNKDVKDVIISRFSKKLGVVDNNNLAGEPIYLSLSKKSSMSAPILSEKESKDFEKKLTSGIVYNIPGKAALEIEFNNKLYVNKECDVVQFGTRDVLDNKQFGDRNNPLKVIFYPELGAIKQTGSAK